MKTAVIKRIYDNGVQNIGYLTLYNEDRLIFGCYTLELADKNNERRVSCIPRGSYNCVPRTSEKYGKHYHVTGVPNRDLILIHSANYHRDLLGCIGVGSNLYDIDKDGNMDITSSRVTMNALKEKIGEEDFLLQIL